MNTKDRSFLSQFVHGVRYDGWCSVPLAKILKLQNERTSSHGDYRSLGHDASGPPQWPTQRTKSNNRCSRCLARKYRRRSLRDSSDPPCATSQEIRAVRGRHDNKITCGLTSSMLEACFLHTWYPKNLYIFVFVFCFFFAPKIDYTLSTAHFAPHYCASCPNRMPKFQK